MNLTRTLSRSLTRWIGVGALGLALAASAVAQTSDTKPLTAEQKKETLSRLELALTSQAYVPGVDFSKWNEMIAEEKESLDGAKTPMEFATVVNSVLSKYKFSHISLFTPDYGTQRQTQRRAGIGIRIEIEEGGVRVTAVFPDSPAVDAGIQPGDLIYEADGKAVKGVAELAGELNQTSTIKLKRDGVDKTLEVTRREYKTVIPESLAWVGPNKEYALLTIPTFDVGYSAENVNSLIKEINGKAKGVILDLRGNGGGRVVNLQHLAGYFVDAVDEPLGTFIGRRDVEMYEKSNKPTTDVKAIAEATKAKVRSARLRGEAKPVTVPVAVLVNGGSGSASEMMAAALRDIKAAPLIGSQTAGAVLASVIVPLGEETGGFWVQFPMLDYVTIKGRRLEGNGLVPDVAAPAAKFGEEDKGVTEAVNQLRIKIAEQSGKAKDGTSPSAA